MTGAVDGFLFIDPGTSTGMCLVVGEEVRLRTVKMRRGLGWLADVARYYDRISELIRSAAPRAVVVEAYAPNAKGSAVHKMVEMGSAVRLAASREVVPLVEMPISLWKSLTFRAKKKNKSQQLDYIYRAEQLTGTRPANIDEADALLMAHAADVTLGDLTRWTEGMEKFRARVKEALKSRPPSESGEG